MKRLALRTGVRWKISIAIAAVGALVAMALSLVVHNAAQVSMLDNAREVQLERLLFAQRMYDSTHELKFGTKLNDPALPNDLRKKVQEGRRATYVRDSGDGTPDVWAAVPLENGVLSLHSKFADRSVAIMKDLDRALLIGSVCVVVGGCALGVLIGGQLSRRLRKAAAAAGKVAQGNTDVRVREAVGGVVRDETDELARAVDALTDALNERIEAERRVTADIAHELRTPVTGLLTAAELLPPGRPTELVRDRAQAMRTLVEDVLEVARLDSASERAELQEVALGEFVSRRVALLDPDVRIQVVHDSRVNTDPRRLERILGNLLANAAKHGGTPVEVTVEGRVVRVRDHGPGFPDALLRDGPSRFRTGASDRAGHGHGLGLTIAAGQARVLGARLTFRNAAPESPTPGPEETGGAIAVLWLPEHAPTATGSFPMITLPD
ncbi:two-component system sensor histidine kinase CseC [Streptomyces sp. NP-1717]|uniref:two-component system sensor histidine kinase CseC n=1 Tax=unclassified Streptomyces TaxID=2593676 RepID=UPI001F5DC404|nr:two-component system sensor histidine kinase CseC [Streptomyces sp. NP-1717]MCI3224819.1 HAMP domain-containing histidine kinase [Streptomyces sp. NP-1717]WTA75022.1 HAMP domain-containing sensor histidine kinase [Streptomyces sp. NBC_00838]